MVFPNLSFQIRKLMTSTGVAVVISLGGNDLDKKADNSFSNDDFCFEYGVELARLFKTCLRSMISSQLIEALRGGGEAWHSTRLLYPQRWQKRKSLSFGYVQSGQATEATNIRGTRDKG